MPAYLVYEWKAGVEDHEIEVWKRCGGLVDVPHLSTLERLWAEGHSLMYSYQVES